MNAITALVDHASGFDPSAVMTSFMGTPYMEPTIRRDSLIFLGPALKAGERIHEVLYSLPYDGRHEGAVRRLSFAGKRGRYVLTCDNAPLSDEVSREQLVECGARPVYGALLPFDYRFGLWMRDRFAS